MASKTKLKSGLKLTCRLCGSHDIRIEHLSGEMYLVICSTCDAAHRAVKSVALATDDDIRENHLEGYICQ